MAELATIARPYAEALYKSAQQDLEATASWLEELAAVAADPDAQSFADNPKVTSSQVFDLVTGVAKSDLSEAGKNFLRAVIENGRLSVLPEIAKQFRALKNASGGVSDAVVYSAFPVEGAMFADLSALLEKKFGRKLQIKVELEPGLIGGIRVVVGDEVLDTSVKARLEQMKVALTA